jgi:hypothetical protein
MNIPQSSIEPFGYTGVPVLMVKHFYNKEALLGILYKTVANSFADAAERWHVILRARACGIELPWAHDLLALRTELRGGEDVQVNITETGDGFYINISFGIPHSNTRYGDFMEYPNGHNAS